MYYAFVIFLLPFFACASEIDTCNQIHEVNQKHLCLAVATLSVGDCEKITNLDQKMTCIFKVRNGQRQANGFHPMANKHQTSR